MGVLNFEVETRHLQKITAALKRRDLLPVTDEEEWEIHGPHDQMNYQVYVGYAVSKDDPNDCPLVAIYPRAIYEIEERSDWGRVLPEKKISTIFSEGGYIPQFPDESGWNVKDYTYAPYFYEHITPEVVNELVIATAERLYKVVTIRFYDHPHSRHLLCERFGPYKVSA